MDGRFSTQILATFCGSGAAQGKGGCVPRATVHTNVHPLCGAQEGLVWGSPGTAIPSHCPCVSQADEQTRACYEHTMAEWLGCEAIVRQREKESHAAALAKCSSGASLDSHIQRMMHRDSTISNEVRVWGGLGQCPPSVSFPELCPLVGRAPPFIL